MPYMYDILYALSLVVVSPWLLFKVLTTGKYRRGLAAKLGGRAFLRTSSRPCAWFHGVSVGEIHLLRQIIRAFRDRHPEWHCVVSTTTDTGFEEAHRCFPDLAVFYWPFDFSWSVGRALRRVGPSLVVLAEGELWPNFLLAAGARGVPVAVVNGRMSPRSFRRFRWFTPLVRALLKRVDVLAAQTEEYASCYRALGADPPYVHVTGSVKYDGAETNRDNSRTRQLRQILGIQPGNLVWIAGSTQPPEERICLGIFQRLHRQHPDLRLVLVPRQKERFEEVARILRESSVPFLRRSMVTGPIHEDASVLLVDTIGELGALWGLADVAFVGGSLDGRRGGQNLIEPAAYGAAVVFGPDVWNFRDTAVRLVRANAAVQVKNEEGLEETIKQLLGDRAERDRLGGAARALVMAQQGATERTLDLIDQLVVTRLGQKQAA